MKKFVCAILAAIMVLNLGVFCGCAAESDSENDPDDKLFRNAVSYSYFGAVGDGVTDDFDAIKRAHEHANEHGVAVKAERGKKYYIAPREDCIPVKTDVDWTGAEFIIDDKSADKDSRVWWYSLFNVKREEEPVNVEAPENMRVAAGQKKLDLTFGKSAMLMIYNDNHNDFIRYGTGLTGYKQARQELLIVDSNGNIDPSTPVQWEYETVTRIVAYPTDDRPVLLRGGKFTTIANDDPIAMHYYMRNIKIERSNTRVKNVQHYVTGEGDEGSPYGGFYRVDYACDVTFENCVLTAHKAYVNQYNINQGTYDTALNNCNNVKYLNCMQSNDITGPTYGVICTDLCKNLYMLGCKLSRFDAHMGVYNATIKDCELGQHVSITGGGTLLLENVVTYAKKGTYFNRFITLRHDYGSFFYGDIIVKDCVMYSERGINYLIGGGWNDWDFGYECRYPRTVTIDNVRLVTDTDEYDHGCLYIFSRQSDNTTYQDALKSKNPPVLTEKVIIKNNIDPATGNPKTIFKTIPPDGGDWFQFVEIENVS